MSDLEASQPPNPPWRELGVTAPGPAAYLSIYLSDDLARLPVRGVTLPRNNKSDPNLETMSFGLFSTCEAKMRSGVVRRNIHRIFFATNHRRRGRALTGYYRLKWWCEGSFGAARGDFALAAERERFTDPILFESIRGNAGAFIRRPFRQVLLLPAEIADELSQLLDGLPDRTADYVAEIERLERFNRFHTGSRYAGWADGQGFTWKTAANYLRPPSAATTDAVPNESPSGWWHCGVCSQDSRNKALLKRCPLCGAVGSLTPVTQPGTQ